MIYDVLTFFLCLIRIILKQGTHSEEVYPLIVQQANDDGLLLRFYQTRPSDLEARRSLVRHIRETCEISGRNTHAMIKKTIESAVETTIQSVKLGGMRLLYGSLRDRFCVKEELIRSILIAWALCRDNETSGFSDDDLNHPVRVLYPDRNPRQQRHLFHSWKTLRAILGNQLREMIVLYIKIWDSVKHKPVSTELNNKAVVEIDADSQDMILNESIMDESSDDDVDIANHSREHEDSKTSHGLEIIANVELESLILDNSTDEEDGNKHENKNQEQTSSPLKNDNSA